MALRGPGIRPVAEILRNLARANEQRREMDKAMGIIKEGTVQKRGQSKSGKPTITIDGQLYYAGKTDLAGLMAGDRIQYSATEFGERGGLWGLDKGWKVLQTASPPSQMPGNSAAPAPSPAATHAKMGSPVIDAERPAISNWVANAITAGLIKTPGDIAQWVQSAKEALRADTSFGTDRDIP